MLIGKGGRPEEKSTISCPSCGYSNDRKRTNCSVCDYVLVMVGRPEEKSKIPCPSCGHFSDVEKNNCSVCNHVLLKRGRPLESGTEVDIFCPNCHQMNSTETLVCDNCSQPLKQRILRGRPVERREVCQNCLQPNSFACTMCTRCGEPCTTKWGKSSKFTVTHASSGIDVVLTQQLSYQLSWIYPLRV